MATQQIFSIYDKKATTYCRPFFEVNEVNAVRGLTMAVQNPDIQISQFPSDFELYKLGEFEDDSGVFTLEPHPVFVVSAATVLRDLQDARRKEQMNAIQEKL